MTVQKAIFLPGESGGSRFVGVLRAGIVSETLDRVGVIPAHDDLLRRLYESGRDPVLGADLMDVSLMFTDIADFTTHAEKLPPRLLAQALGRYPEAATNAVEATGGTLDKYIGDALMVLWNAPEPVPQHPIAARRAAVACAEATRALCASDWWRAAALPVWHTRFGLRTDRVLVGNFGAPARLSYTAMGDGARAAEAHLGGGNEPLGPQAR